jgi:hypothetical protein
VSRDPETLGIFARIKVFFGGLASLALGGFLYLAPVDEIREFEWHRQVGIAAMIFGGLMLLVLLSEGAGSRAGRAFNFRIKSLLATVASALFAGVIGWYLVPNIHNASRLAADGRGAQAVRVATHVSRVKKTTSWSSTVRYDGHKGRVSGSVGKTVAVVYLPEQPEVVMKGVEGDGFLALIDKNLGQWKALGMGLLGLFLALTALVKLKHFFFGRGERPQA